METPNAPDAVVAEIDRLAAASQAAPQDVGAMSAVWRALYGLDRWLFIARGELTDPRPYAISLPQGPMVLAFTTAQRAQAAGRANGLSEEEVRHILAIPLPGAIEWAAGLASTGIMGIAFDHGVSPGPFAPLANLIPMRDWFAANPVSGSPANGSAPAG